jgi:hypothetical protein
MTTTKNTGMNTGRVYWFAAAILIGFVGGVAAGWIGLPVGYRNTPPEELRYDYQADYVLMTAEVYAKEKNAASAAARLAFLGNEPVLRYVQRAIVTGQELEFTKHDMSLLGKLSDGLQAWMLNPEEELQP